MNGFDPNAINSVPGTPGVVRFAGVDGWPSRPYGTDWNNFGPRVGFAWRPFGAERTVVRGGAGIFYAHPFDHGAPSSASLADHDDRVVPSHSFKYAATLQKAASSENPVLIRIETRSGHGASNVTKQTETTADIYAFIM